MFFSHFFNYTVAKRVPPSLSGCWIRKPLWEEVGVCERPFLACPGMLTWIAFCISALEQNTFLLMNNFKTIYLSVNHISRDELSKKHKEKVMLQILTNSFTTAISLEICVG